MKKMFFLSFFLFLTPWCRADQPLAKPKLQIGIAHVDGRYHFTQQHYLDEGAAEIEKLGAKCIKVYLTLDTDRPATRCYGFGSAWPRCQTLAELADSPPFRRLFARPFETFLLTTFRAGQSAGYWVRQFNDQDARAEEEEMYRLTRHLLTQYRGTGKTFILQNWEGDWAVRGHFDPKKDPAPEQLERMTRWLQARQKGVQKAREEQPGQGVRVLHAVEVNLVRAGMEKNRPCVANRVVPAVVPDLVSYSCWETQQSPTLLARCLAWLAEQTPDRPPFGKYNVYIGEFGCPENIMPPEKQRSIVTNVLGTAREFGCPFAAFWAIHCNEPLHEPVKNNEDVKGFCLIRPDGTHSLAWELLSRALQE